jgi:hypothetical protein
MHRPAAFALSNALKMCPEQDSNLHVLAYTSP